MSIKFGERATAFVGLHPRNLHLAVALAGIRYEQGDPSGSRERVDRLARFDPASEGRAALSPKLTVAA